MVDCDAVVRQLVKAAPIYDIDLAKPRATLDHQATAFGENQRQM
jgi:hypothetical protein